MKLSYKLKIIRNFIYSLYSYICFYYLNETLNKNEKKKVFHHFLKSQEIIIIYFFIISLISNIISIVRFGKKLIYLENNKKKEVFKFLKKIKIIKFQKSIELVHALIILSTNYNEKVNRIDISNYDLNNNELFVENVVIGSGPSGSVTALSLIEKGKDTLLIESGKYFSIPDQKHSGYEFVNKWLYGGLSGAIGNIDLQYASANCLGGGSEINSGLYHEIDQNFITKIYNDKKIYDLIKNYEPKDIVEIQKNHSKELINLKNIYVNASRILNWKVDDLKKFMNNQTNKKNSMTNTYIKKYLEMGGKIIDNSKVIKLVEANNTCVVELKNKKKNFKLKCKNIFLCCGSPYTLNLLKSSNLVPKNINSDFHFHPMFKIIAKYDERVNSNKSIDIIESQITEFFPNYIFGNAASGKQFLKISTFNNLQAYQDVEKNFEYMTMFHATFSLGKSNFIKVPFLKEPLISYKFTNKELSLINEGIENLIKFIFKSGAKYIYLNDKEVTKINYDDYLKSEKFLDKIELSLSSVHLLGGMNMRDSKLFDEKMYGKLKNKNINVFVNDSTLLNEKLLKNPQGTVMAISKANITHNLKNI